MRTLALVAALLLSCAGSAQPRAVSAPSNSVPTLAACLELPTMDCVECRVTTLLEEARRAKDVVRTVCLHARLTELRAWQPKAIAGDSEAATAIARIEREATECRGEGPEFVGGTTVTEHDGCADHGDR